MLLTWSLTMGVVLAKELWKEGNVPFLDLGLERSCVFFLLSCILSSPRESLILGSCFSLTLNPMINTCEVELFLPNLP